jgi:putative spermidine/putrescine transport system permease protein
MTIEAEMTMTKAAPARAGRGRTGWRVAALLAAPGALWMTAFLVIPIAMMVYVSFWTQKTFTIEPVLTLQNWASFFSTSTYLSALWTTLRIWLIVLISTLVAWLSDRLVRRPVRQEQDVQTALLVLCVIPFWTSFLIRVIAWRPMLGKEGAINIILMKLGVIISRSRRCCSPSFRS